jgi:hypothetical protein
MKLHGYADQGLPIEEVVPSQLASGHMKDFRNSPQFVVMRDTDEL